MDFLSLVQALHDETGVDIPEADYWQVDTLEGLLEHLVAAVAGPSPLPAAKGVDEPRP